MAIKVRQNFVSSSKYKLKCPYLMDAETITVHNTLNKASADNEVRYMIGNNNATSFHYAVDGHEVVQGIPYGRNAWHAGDGSRGDGNRKSLSVEICYSTGTAQQYAKAEDMAIQFIAELLYERKWGVDRVRTHKSWTEIGVKKGYSRYVKECPHRILKDGRWSEFIAAVQKQLNALKGVPTVTPATKPKPSTPSASKPSASKPSTSKPSVSTQKGSYSVVKGDTLYSIADKFNMTVTKLKSVNGLKSNLLQVGQALHIEGAYTVQKGDTLYAISRKYKLSVAELKKANGLKSDELEIGQLLVVEKAVSAPAPKPVVPKKQYHTVAYGNTLSEIAVKYKTTSSKIAALNGSVKNIHKIYVGQKIRVA